MADWEDDQLREAYSAWLGAWIGGLSPPQRVAFELLAFGAAVGTTTHQQTSCLPSTEAQAIFMPESRLLWLPTAGSHEEFAARLTASIELE